VGGLALAREPELGDVGDRGLDRGAVLLADLLGDPELAAVGVERVRVPLGDLLVRGDVGVERVPLPHAGHLIAADLDRRDREVLGLDVDRQLRQGVGLDLGRLGKTKRKKTDENPTNN
jgi:hypothetical protein